MENRYECGQIWSYRCRAGEEESFLVVVAEEPHPQLEQIVNIYVSGLRIRNSRVESGITEVISHLPFAKSSMDESVLELIGFTETLPPFGEGYDQWRIAFDEGDAGVFTIPVAEVIEAMEKTLED